MQVQPDKDIFGEDRGGPMMFDDSGKDDENLVMTMKNMARFVVLLMVTNVTRHHFFDYYDFHH